MTLNQPPEQPRRTGRPGSQSSIRDLRVRGSGDRLVVLDAGFRDATAAWGRIPGQLRPGVNVLTIDRTAHLASLTEPMNHPFEELREVTLASAGDETTILVGWALGALFVNEFAAMYPEDTGGLVLIDPVPPAFVRHLLDRACNEGPDASPYATELIAEILELTRIGASDLFAEPDVNVSATIPQIHVLRGHPPAADDRVGQLWTQLQQHSIRQHSNIREVIAGRSGENLPTDRPDVILDAIRELLQRAKR